jgi:hypothetical protein
MGVCDYTCAVERNGQNLRGFVPGAGCLGADEVGENDSSDERDDWSSDECDDWSAGAGEAVLVAVPEAVAVREILSWGLSKFAEFPAERVDYDWDGWCFVGVEGYSEVLTRSATSSWYDTAIWSSPSRPGKRLVNFHPAAYEAFVTGRTAARDIPRGYLKEVFSNRDRPWPGSELLAVSAIRDCGALNLWEYDGLDPIAVDPPQEYSELRSAIAAHLPVSATYAFDDQPPADIPRARLAVLLEDHAAPIGPSSLANFSRVELRDSGRSNWRLDLSAEVSAEIELPEALAGGCLVCQRPRDLASLLCLEHANVPVGPLLAPAAARLAEAGQARMGRMEELLRELVGVVEVGPPALRARFWERGRLYDCVLRCCGASPGKA